MERRGKNMLCAIHRPAVDALAEYLGDRGDPAAAGGARTETILYVCVHNAGRSQMAQALTNRLARARGLPVRALSAGTAPGDRINPAAVEVMREIGIPMRRQRPRQLTRKLADQADRIITMGCGVDADACPSRTLMAEDWKLDDPAGQPVEKVRAIRDRIQARVETLLDEVEEARRDR